MLKCTVQVMRWRDTRAHRPAICTRYRCTLCTINEQLPMITMSSLKYPRPKSITHLHTFSDNGVYVALQLFLVILVSDPWSRVLMPYSYWQAAWGLRPMALCGMQATKDTLLYPDLLDHFSHFFLQDLFWPLVSRLFLSLFLSIATT